MAAGEAAEVLVAAEAVEEVAWVAAVAAQGAVPGFASPTGSVPTRTVGRDAQSILL